MPASVILGLSLVFMKLGCKFRLDDVECRQNIHGRIFRSDYFAGNLDEHFGFIFVAMCTVHFF